VRAAGLAVSTRRMTRTDPDGYVMLPYRMRLPLVPGHEFAGEVVDVGTAVDSIAIGDPVAVETLRPCGSCRSCRRGLPNGCTEGGFAGFTEDGGLAEYAVAPVERVLSLSSLVPRYDSPDLFALGAVCEPAGVVAVALSRLSGGMRPGARVVVLGCGPLGQAAVALTRAGGAGTVLAIDTSPTRTSIAAQMGADDTWGSAADPSDWVTGHLGPAGADLVVDATNDPAAVLPVIQQIVAVGGDVLHLGVGGSAASFSTIGAMVRGTTHAFSMGHLGGLAPVIDLMAAGRLDLRPMLGRRWQLEDVTSALADPDAATGAKSIVVMPDAS
jgi:threonine dehydrogenase-like Zn-dependent dehydrogenase